MRVRFTGLLPVLLLPALLSTTGCGMEAVDTRVQARSEVGLDLHPLKVAEQQWVCPNVVTITNQTFDPKTVAAGEVEDQFGPFVPCGTVVAAGEGTCPNCKKAYRTDGPAPDYEQVGEQDLPNLAVPKFECPHCDELVDPVAVLSKGSKQARAGDSVCPSCNEYFTVIAADEQLVVDVHEETFCPGCKQPVDPTMNMCTNRACKLGGVIRAASGYVGPCWRCGGTSVCPNCSGTGQGSQGIYGSTPAQCWYCDGHDEPGRCPECDEHGFVRYEGVLPNDYQAWTKGTPDQSPQPYEQSRRKWRFDRASAPSE